MATPHRTSEQSATCPRRPSTPAAGVAPPAAEHRHATTAQPCSACVLWAHPSSQVLVAALLRLRACLDCPENTQAVLPCAALVLQVYGVLKLLRTGPLTACLYIYDSAVANVPQRATNEADSPRLVLHSQCPHEWAARRYPRHQITASAGASAGGSGMLCTALK